MLADQPARTGGITTVIFDFDGVIADTERLHLAAFQEVFRERGWKLDESAYFDRYLGYDDRGLVVAYGEDQKLTVDKADVQRLVDAKTSVFARYLTSRSVLFPGASAAIEAIAARFSVGIASGALHQEIDAILTTAGLHHLFPVIVAADDVTACKPSPVPYLTAAEGLGVSPSACVAIEDSPAGLEAARRAGMRTIGVTTTLTSDALVDADRIIAGLHELTPNLVAALGEARTV